ncbi:MAG: acetate/propionate family kinase [Candidatus Binataceae bacterium]
MTAERVILCFNAGSSSCKFALYAFAGAHSEPRPIAIGQAEGVGAPRGKIRICDAAGRALAEASLAFARPRDAVDAAVDAIEQLKHPRPAAVGHRIVHGGPNHAAPERITDALAAELKRLIPFAPLHLPAGIEGIEAAAARYPGLPQVACFDTAFHRAMPEIAQRLPIPRELWDEGVRRYGFHGISYEYIMRTLGSPPPRRVIIAHLGNGASMAAVLNGKPAETTMGFTPAGGFMMGTRPGDLDPGVLAYLMKEKHFTADRIDRTINFESGLLGVSGLSADMKTLLETAPANPHAAQAVEMFCYHLRKTIGGLAAVMGGLDLLVFTGGIGERAAPIRAGACRGMAHLGIELDERRNITNADTINVAGALCTVRVIPTDENLMIARHTNKLVFEGR